MSTPGVHCNITWHSMGDACRVCQSLNGYVWTDADIYQGVLFHPMWGDVWNLDLDAPLTHGGSGINCHCWISTETIIRLDEMQSLQDLGVLFEQPMDEEIVVDGNDLGQIDDLREKIQGLSDEISNMSLSYGQAREYETLARRTLLMLEKATGSGNIKQAEMAITHAISTIRTLQFALVALEGAEGPVGWAMAISGLAMAGYSAYSTYNAVRSIQ